MRLDKLKDDLYSEDVRTTKKAEREIPSILDWLYGPMPKVSDADKKKKIQEALNIADDLESMSAIRRITRSTGRQRGRPRDESSQHAVLAITMHLATRSSWREIALEIVGCNHHRPNHKERACHHCGEKLRKAAERLDKFLKRNGLYPNFPGQKDLDRLSLAQLRRLWEQSSKKPPRT